MSELPESVPFVSVAGEKEELRVTVYALSTCAFCKRGMSYLREHGIAFRYVFLDELEFELKRELKTHLKSTYKDLPLYPILTVDDSRAHSGFKTARWAELIGIQPDEETSG